jgi:general secretion pathway protein J
MSARIPLPVAIASSPQDMCASPSQRACGSSVPLRAAQPSCARRNDLASRAGQGFTLIEVLLATALLAAALALGFATLSSATAIVRRGEQLSQRNERMRAAANFLRVRISSARAIGFSTDPQSGAPIRFIGEPDRIRFVADLPDYLGRGGPFLHDISVVRGDDDKVALQVVFTQVQNAAQVANSSPHKPEALATGLSDVQFRYRALDATGALDDWQERWTSADSLPLQVAVRIIGADKVAWPELVITLPVSTGASATPRARP